MAGKSLSRSRMTSSNGTRRSTSKDLSGDVLPIRKITMTDIARVAGCSQATVSVVLNNSTGIKISDEMRTKVIEAARDLNYSPGLMAHHHATFENGQQTINDSVGFIVDQLATSPEAVVAVEGVRQALWEESRIVLTAQTMNDPEMEEKTVAALAQNGISGLIYMTIFTRKTELPDCIKKLKVPVVLLNCYESTPQRPSIVPGEVEGGYRATKLLLDHGHTHIAMITGEPWMEATRDRMKGYRRALHEAGVPYHPELVLQGNWSPSSGFENTRKLISLAKRPTAIFCQNDRMAIGCYEALKEAGLRIPEEMSVVGYDDEEISRHLSPQLSTVVLPHRAMGHLAVKRLDELVSGKLEKNISREHVDCTLVIRDSVARPCSSS
jgi:LacI family transcriptional regulator